MASDFEVVKAEITVTNRLHMICIRAMANTRK